MPLLRILLLLLITTPLFGSLRETQYHKVRIRELKKGQFVYPEGKFSGKGIVVAAGGTKYLTNAFVTLSILRWHGCTLPVQLWHIGQEEITAKWIDLFATIGVTCHDITNHFSFDISSYMAKPLALMASSFEEVLMLDADNVTLRDPSFLFDDPSYLETGTLFWPDSNIIEEDCGIWSVLELPSKRMLAQESGQIVMNKRVCWQALQFTLYMNQHSSLFYKLLLGDKDTFFLGCKVAGKSFAMNSYYPGFGQVQSSSLIRMGTCGWALGFVQRDFAGEPLFYHMIHNKWEPKLDFQFKTNTVLMPEGAYRYLPLYKLVDMQLPTPLGVMAHQSTKRAIYPFDDLFPFVKLVGYRAIKTLLNSGVLSSSLP